MKQNQNFAIHSHCLFQRSFMLYLIGCSKNTTFSKKIEPRSHTLLDTNQHKSHYIITDCLVVWPQKTLDVCMETQISNLLRFGWKLVCTRFLNTWRWNLFNLAFDHHGSKSCFFRHLEISRRLVQKDELRKTKLFWKYYLILVLSVPKTGVLQYLSESEKVENC